MENKTELTQPAAPLSQFEQAQRQAKALSASDLVPQQYKNNAYHKKRYDNRTPEQWANIEDDNDTSLIYKAKKKETALAVVDNTMFEQDAHDGMDNISSEDVALPFLKLLSQLSPEIENVKGAKAGMIYNTVSGEVYDGTQGIKVIPCHYERKYIEWQPRGSGSGAPIAVHPATSDIMTKTFRKPGESKDYLDNGNYIENSAQHYVMIVGDDGTCSPALIVLKSTQLKKSRKWNSMMMTLKMNGKNGPFTPPSYSHVYRLTSSGI